MLFNICMLYFNDLTINLSVFKREKSKCKSEQTALSPLSVNNIDVIWKHSFRNRIAR